MSWRTAAALLTLREQVDAAAPGRSKRSDGTIGDPAHAARTSDHNPNAAGVVRALDLTHDPSAGADMAALSEALRGSRDQRIKYLIFDGRICSATVSPWVWRSYYGSNPHRTHLHVSVSNRASIYDADGRWTLPWATPHISSEEQAMIEDVVTGIQQALTDAGGDPGPVDGRWGPRTQDGLTEALKARGGGGLSPKATGFLEEFVNVAPDGARPTSLWHVLRLYRDKREHFEA